MIRDEARGFIGRRFYFTFKGGGGGAEGECGRRGGDWRKRCLTLYVARYR